MRESVWLVTYGSYSDYRVICVCLSREIADAVKEKYAGSELWDYDIEERVCITSADDMSKVMTYWVSVDQRGEETQRYADEFWLLDAPDDGAWPNGAGACARSARSFDAALHAARDKLIALRSRDG